MTVDLQNDANDDHFGETEADASNPGHPGSGMLALNPEAKDQWKSLRKKIRLNAEKQSAKKVLGAAVKRGGIYRWGIEAASSEPLSDIDITLSRLACSKKVRKQDLADIDWASELDFAVGQVSLAGISDSQVTPLQCVRAVMWAAAMPSLIDHLDYTAWWDLLGELQRFRESMLEQEGAATLPRLIVAGEMGLTLAWRLAHLPSCKRLRKSSADAVKRWCEHEEDSIASTIAGGNQARLGLASLIRCRSIMQSSMGQKFTKQQRNVLADLATWVAAMTTHGGGSAFVDHQLEMRDDLSKNGLLDAAIGCDPDSLRPAMNAARGKTQTGGRLVWEISLPETVHHCDQSQLAVMLCEWDVSAGRMHIDYSQPNVRIEMRGRKKALLAGVWESSIEIDSNEQRSTGPWVSTCEFSDDDCHYLELEQVWTGGLILQRQFLTVRDDRAVMMADTVLSREDSVVNDNRSIRYTSRIPFADGVTSRPEKETREIYLQRKRDEALVVPISASEWRVGATTATLRVTDDQNLLLLASGKDSLYAPLWFDFQTPRFKRKRTWRQLTVADELRVVGSDEAVGFRIQMGSEQWMIYRSLHGSRCRSVLGKHLVADFFAGRFFMSDGSIESIVSVDDNDSES